MNLDDNYLEFEEPAPEQPKDNTKIILVIVAAVILLCGCGFLLSGWLWWGDILVDSVCRLY